MSTDEIPVYEIPESSENGHWHKGFDYSPTDGMHKGHSITVVNPSADIKAPVPSRVNGRVVIALKPAKVVYVRCETCLMSWFFDEGEQLT